MINYKVIHSLEKVFPHNEPMGELKELSLFENEKMSWQVAFQVEKENWGKRNAAISVEGELACYIIVKHVGLVPCEFPCYEKADDYLFTEPCLVPDVLETLENNVVSYLPGRWESLWITLDGGEQALPTGKHSVVIKLTTDNETICAELEVEILPIALPPQRLLFTQWFHCDAVACYHHTRMFSERFWEIAERYVKMAADYGINVLYTPLFTPPLDVLEGGERMTCQLVDVFLDKNGYAFGFERLSRWIDMARRCGINRFELSHLFSQWGAKHPPKIVSVSETGEHKLFGWESPVGGDYKQFLSEFLSALDAFLRTENIDEIYLHVSDEPTEDDLESYAEAYSIVKRCMPDYPIMDAISDYKIYQRSRLSDPVVALNHIEPFLEKGIGSLWGYYCCAQNEEVPNRFLAMPSYRNRIAGILCYKFGLKGFLQWGYNFYNTQFSLRPIDPYASTDAGRGFPSGDPFSVYPENDGCTESLRLSVFREALQDHRALCLLEELVGKSAALDFIEEMQPGMTFRNYPHNDEFLLNFRRELNSRILKYIG